MNRKDNPLKKSLFPVGLLLIFCTLAHGAESRFHLLKTLPLGGDGRWDYPTVDGAAKRLYLSRSTHVMVVDTETGKVVGDIPDTPGVHGIAVAPELGRGFISNGKADTATIFDLKTLKALGQVKTGENPDAVLYDPASKRVFTFNGHSHDATAFDAATGEPAGTMALGGKPEFAVGDAAGKIYVNIEDTSEVVEIDSRKLEVTKRFSIAPCEEPTGIALDLIEHRLFSGCHNKVMVVSNSETGKVIGTVPIGEGVDGVAFDPELKLAFSANGDGTLTVVEESPQGSFRVAETVLTQHGARTIAIDPATHELYLPTAEFLPPPVQTPEGPKSRPEIVKDSFTVLVVGK